MPRRIVAVVTGMTAGIGLATARALLERGAAVIGIGRDPEKCRQVQELLLADPARLAVLCADMSTCAGVRQAAALIGIQLDSWGFSGLDALVNNAGTVSSWYVNTREGYELQFATNHLAPFLLSLLLKSKLKMTPAARIITVSSASHYRTRIHWKDVMFRRHYHCLRAYKQSKLANVMFTCEFNRRYGDANRLRAYAVDPGLVCTDIGLKGTHGLESLVWRWRQKSGCDPAVPGQAIAALAVDPGYEGRQEIYWCQGRPKKPSRNSRDPAQGSRLWTLSENLCGWLEPIAE